MLKITFYIWIINFDVGLIPFCQNIIANYLTFLELSKRICVHTVLCTHQRIYIVRIPGTGRDDLNRAHWD
jgi:hypothetical protein